MQRRVASQTIERDIFDRPYARSRNVIGTSTMVHTRSAHCVHAFDLEPVAVALRALLEQEIDRLAVDTHGSLR